MINEDANKSMNILEVEWALGDDIIEIKNRYKNDNLYGTEICRQEFILQKVI